MEERREGGTDGGRQHRRAGNRPSSKRIKRERREREMHTGDHAVKGEKVERSWCLDTLDLWKKKELLSAGHSSGAH